MKIRRWTTYTTAVALAALSGLAPGALQAQGMDEDELPERSTPTLRAQPVQGEVDVDGHLDEAVWEEAPVATGFVQIEPVEGAPAEEETEVRVLFGEDAVYVGARMHDSRPSTIADQLVRRDQRGQYDFFEVAFDPNLDRRTGYLFRVSAAGVQRDEYLYSDSEQDDAWDAVWASAVSRDSLGWVAEMRIPLSQLLYEPSDTARVWGVNFQRRRLASNERTVFALVSRLQQGVVSQFGELEGVRIAEASRRLELVPYGLTSAHTGPAERGNPFFDGSETDARLGADFRYGIGGNFTLDAAVNPDFGQVEADPAVINLTAFETFFEERRPFFVEDARIFDFNLSGGRNSLFYSRRVGGQPHGRAPGEADFSRIPDASTILGAAKLTGRTPSGLSVGALVASTQEEEGKAYFGGDDRIEEFLVEPRSQYGVFRIQQDFNGGASQIGAIVAGMNRELPMDGSFDHLPSSAFDGGVDFEIQWNDREWALDGFLAGSHVRGDSTAMIRLQRSSTHYFQRPDAEYVSMDSSATAMSGAEWRLQFERRRGDWTGAVWAAEVTPGFEINDIGFSQEQERLDGGARIGYRDITPGEHLRSWNANVFTFHNWSHDVLENGVGSWAAWEQSHMRGVFMARGQVEFLNYWELNGSLGYSPRSQSRTATRGGPVMLDPASFRSNLRLQTDRRRAVNVGPRIEYNRYLTGTQEEFNVSMDVELRPSSRLELSLEPRLSLRTNPTQYVIASGALSYTPTFGPRYVFADLERQEFSVETRLNWSFSPHLTLQVFAQPFISAGDYVSYKQFLEPGTFLFDTFEEGSVATRDGEVTCVGGRTCEDADHTRYLDFDGDGRVDETFADRDFNFRSLIGNAVLRWEYRPGSRIFLVWQRQQSERAALGGLDVGRDASALFDAEPDDRFILKVDYWLGL